MNHEEVKEQLSAYLDGELDAPIAEAVERHLRECSECRDELRSLKRTVSMLRSLPRAKAPNDLLERVRVGISSPPAEVSRGERIFRWSRKFVPLLAAAGILLVLAVGYMKVERGRTISSVAVEQELPAKAITGVAIKEGKQARKAVTFSPPAAEAPAVPARLIAPKAARELKKEVSKFSPSTAEPGKGAGAEEATHLDVAEVVPPEKAVRKLAEGKEPEKPAERLHELRVVKLQSRNPKKDEAHIKAVVQAYNGRITTREEEKSGKRLVLMVEVPRKHFGGCIGALRRMKTPKDRKREADKATKMMLAGKAKRAEPTRRTAKALAIPEQEAKPEETVTIKVILERESPR